jgi:hypothetical protein
MAAPIDKTINRLENTLDGVYSCVRYSVQVANQKTHEQLENVLEDLVLCRRLSARLDSALGHNKISEAAILSSNLEVIQRNITRKLSELRHYQQGANDIVKAVNAALETHVRG